MQSRGVVLQLLVGIFLPNSSQLHTKLKSSYMKTSKSISFIEHSVTIILIVSIPRCFLADILDLYKDRELPRLEFVLKSYVSSRTLSKCKEIKINLTHKTKICDYYLNN